MIRRLLIATSVLVLSLAAATGTAAQAPPKPVDITGKWTASFDTQIGVQNYTYEFVAKGAVLSGKISSDNGSSEVKDGKIDGATVTFTETLDFQGMSIAITYKGQVTSADEIKFTRQVGEFATEELVAKRAK